MGDVNLKDYFKNFEDKLLVKMPKQEEADITSGKMVLIFKGFRLYLECPLRLFGYLLTCQWWRG